MPVSRVDPPKNGDAPTYDFVCPEPQGCGGDDGPFTSTGWARRKDAVARGRQHAAEHESGQAMPELADFRTNGA